MKKDILDQIFYSEDEKIFECGKYTVEELTYLYNLNEPKILIFIKNVFRVIGAIILIGLCVAMLINILKPIDVAPVSTSPIGNTQQEIINPPVNKPIEQPTVQEPVPDTDALELPVVENTENNSNDSSSFLDILSLPIEFILDIIPDFFDLLAKIGDYIDFDKVFNDIDNIKTVISNPFTEESREIIKEYRKEIRIRIIEQISNNQDINEEKKVELINFVNDTFDRNDKIAEYINNIINKESIII